MENRVGQYMGSYQLTRLLGRGAFAEVYLGMHRYLQTQAAIKILHGQLGDSELENFFGEARTAANLIHPNIVRTLDFGIQDNTPFLVMDYAPYGTLRQRYRYGTQLPVPTVVSYVKQIADALQYAHQKKVVHRDIKPENILFKSEDLLQVSDFGVALLLRSSHIQHTQDIAGTVAYMSPEQIQGKPRPASDQYALAIIAYEWLSGQRPFTGTFSEVAVKHTITPPPSLRETVPSITPAIENIIMIALAKDPERRFPTIKDFSLALEQAAHSDRQTPYPPIPATPSHQQGPLPTLPADGYWRLQIEASAQTPSTPKQDTSFNVNSEKDPAPVSQKQSSSKWRITKQQVIMILVGAVIAGLLSYAVDTAVNQFSILNQPLYSTLLSYFAIANILFCLIRLIPLYMGATYGPYVGVSIICIGYLSDLLAGRGIATFWLIGGLLGACIASLAFFQTQGHTDDAYRLRASILLASIGEALGLAIPMYSRLWTLHLSLLTTTQDYLVETLPTLLLIVALFPVLFLLRKKWVVLKNRVLS